MRLLACPHCGQSYNPSYMRYCARCGEAVPDEGGKLPRRGPMDGMGSRGGSHSPKRTAAGVPAGGVEPHENWRPSKAVDDIVLEYHNRLKETPEDHSTRFALALAYLLTRQWEKAARELAQVVEGMPDYADAHYRLAVALAYCGKAEDALASARRAAALEPGNARFASACRQLETRIDNGN